MSDNILVYISVSFYTRTCSCYPKYTTFE